MPIKHAEEVEQVFDAISYCKGSTVVNMVAAIIGITHYLDAIIPCTKLICPVKWQGRKISEMVSHCT